MDVTHEPPASRKPNIALAFVAFLLLFGALGLLILEVVKGIRQPKSIPPAERVAKERMKQVNTPDFGWFPYQHDPIFGWEHDDEGWLLEDESTQDIASPGASEGAPGEIVAAKHNLHIELRNEEERKSALAVPVHFPTPTTIFRNNSVALTHRMVGVRFIAYDVYIPKECPGFSGCLFFMKDKGGLWYQARSPAALVPGHWTTVTADIRGGSPDVTPLGHLGQWDDNQASQIKMIGITFYGDKDFSGKVLVANFRGWMRPPRFISMVDQINGNAPNNEPIASNHAAELAKLGKSAASFKDDALRVLNFRTEPDAPAGDSAQSAPSSPPMVRKFETFTVCFELNRQVDNPFDPDKADITCMVTTPSGQNLEHIGFWYQDYDRTDRFSGDELKPMGRPEWRIRITPREEGTYKYALSIKLGNEPPLILPAREFCCIPSENKGFIRVSQKDPRFFEFENGEFFYPIGHNLHSPVDIRCWKEIFKQEPPAGRGLNMYSDFFAKMEQNGENTAEVWMASWWLGIEWTQKWSDYYGAGRYSLQHAWKLDAVAEMARQHGISLHLVLDNHGKFSSYCDWEWNNNPYNSILSAGGVANAQEMFTNATTKNWQKNKLRYIAARWGASPQIMGWELVSEYDLVGDRGATEWEARSKFHKSPTLKAWAREMINHIRKCDVYGHPVTIHYATDFQWIDVQLAITPFFDYVVTDAYRHIAKRYTRCAADMQAWATQNLAANNATKPFWITEYGGDNMAAPQPALEADVQCGMWATWMTDGAGVPLFWWYDFIDRKNLYGYYLGFANYVKGEDRRGIKGIMAPLPVLSGTASAGLAGTMYRWNKGAYGWIYNDAAMYMMPAPGESPKHDGVTSAIPELDAGQYQVEYWDCSTGKIVSSEVKDVAAGAALPLKFPAFTINVAVKVKANNSGKK